MWLTAKKSHNNLSTDGEWGSIDGNLSRARGAKSRGVVLLSLQAAGILSYSAYICESCYWCNCIEVLTTICSPLGGPGSSCRWWSGYVWHITACKEKKKFLFRFFRMADNKIQMLCWSRVCLTPSPLPLLSPLSLYILPNLVHLSTPPSFYSLKIHFLLSSTSSLLASSPWDSSILTSFFHSSHYSPEPFLNKGKYLWH